MFEHSPDALLAVREEGTVSNANVRAHALFADPQGAAIGSLIEDGADLVATVLSPDHTPEPGGEARLYHRAASGRHGAFSAEVSVALSGPGIDRGAILAVRDLTERHRMEAALTESLREKDTLLREVHHRVKNNLQIVSSLLTLQSEHVAEPTAQEALAEAVQRVRSMSGVHQQLYGTETLSDINFGEYATTLGASLQASMDPTATFTYDVTRVDLTIDSAVPCGLILNELVTNALKHGRPAAGRSAVTIRVQPTDAGFALSVTGNGPGMKEAPPRSSALGAQLIRSLVRQLRATQSVEDGPGGGTVVTIQVPRPAHRAT